MKQLYLNSSTKIFQCFKPLLLVALLFLITKESFSQFQTCDNYLYVNNHRAGVTIGDLDITGNQLTVEAVFSRVSPSYTAYANGGDLVSKHSTPNDVNYLLRPNLAAITTNQGFFAASTSDPNNIYTYTKYHVAMVYDGNTLTLYRNGNIVAQVAASGNLVTNDWLTTIGTEAYLATTLDIDFVGYISEVRIWNVARSQTDIQTYMNTSLPNPSA